MKNIGNILLLLIVSLLISASPLQIGQARACCLKHMSKCSMHHTETASHCKGNTHNEIQCCEDKCYPNLKYTMAEKPSTNIHTFYTLLNLSIPDISITPTLNSVPSLSFTFLEDFQRKKYSSPPLYILKSSFLN